jgi:hypothetical protein
MVEHHDTVAHGTADDQYRETPPGAGYEHTDANIWIIAKFIFWLAVAAVIIHFGLALLFNLFVEQRVERTDPRYPMAATEGERLPPEPRLQGAPGSPYPREAILNFRSGEETLLHNYGWIDQKTGAVHIPIEDAMRLMLERKALPSRAAAEDGDPGMMPADSSAGRTTEGRR